MNNILYAVACSALICLITTPILIPFLRKLKFGQSIREEGPNWHKSKSGTPTMGGITMILAVVIATVAFAVLPGRIDAEILILLLSAVLFGAIGFVEGENAVQPATFGEDVKSLYFIVLAICSLIAFLSMKFIYNIGKKEELEFAQSINSAE